MVLFFRLPLFEQVLSVIQGTEFHRLSDSVGIIKLFEYNLGLLTDAQKQPLFTTLSESIPELLDSISAFLAVELIAEIWRDNRSLEALLHLTRGASENTLALAVHGLDWLAKKTEQADIRTRCLDELWRLSKHPSSLVQTEAITALNRRMA